MNKRGIKAGIASLVIVIVTLAAFIMLAIAPGNPGAGCPAETKFYDTIRGGVYFEQQGWSESEDNAMERTFENVPPGIKLARVYTGIWQGSPGKGGFFNITIDNATGSYNTSMYRACDPCPNKTNCLVDGHQPARCDALNHTINSPWNDDLDKVIMHDYIVGCGVQFISFNATPYIDEGTNTITVNTEPCSGCYKGGWDGRIYIIALLVVYENESMRNVTYWINEGALYLEENSYCDGPNDHTEASKYFNGTYAPNPFKVKLWSLGWPHVINTSDSTGGWTKLNDCYLGTPNVTESHDSGYNEVLLRWNKIPTGCVDPMNNSLEYHDPHPFYERAFAEVLMVEGIPDKPDLMVTDIKSNSTMMRPGKNYLINATIENDGNTSTAFNVSLKVDGVLPGDEKRVELGLAPGASTTVSFPVNLAYGCHNFTVMADCNTEIDEEKEFNNEKTVDLQVGYHIVVRSKSDFEKLNVSKAAALPSGCFENKSGTYYIQNLKNAYSVKNCAGHGIDIQNTNVHFVIRNCTVHDCLDSGIYIQSVTNGTVNDSEVYGNGLKGIKMENSSYVVIDNNSVHDNADYGVDIYLARMPKLDSHHITVSNNNITRNYYGVELIGSNCTIRDNLILNSTAWAGGEEGYGIYVIGNHSEIYNNTIKYSDSYGMYVDYDSNMPTIGNSIYANSFIDNNQLNLNRTSQAYDSGDNYWNSTEKLGYYLDICPCALYNYIGNYWSNYSGVDANGDKIGDTWYAINDSIPVLHPPSENDTAPLMEPWMNYSQVLPPPYNLDINTSRALAEDNRTVRISWDGSADAYDIYVTDDYAAGFDDTPTVEDVTTTYWNDTNAYSSPIYANATQRYYKVVNANESADAYSEVVGKYDVKLECEYNLISVPYTTTKTGINEVLKYSLWPGKRLTGTTNPATADEVLCGKCALPGAWLVDAGPENPATGQWFTGMASSTLPLPSYNGLYIHVRPGHTVGNVTLRLFL